MMIYDNIPDYESDADKLKRQDLYNRLVFCATFLLVLASLSVFLWVAGTFRARIKRFLMFLIKKLRSKNPARHCPLLRPIRT